MYNNYNSLRDIIQKDIENQKSVLNKFPEHISRPITQSCSKYLAQFTSYQLPFKADNNKQQQQQQQNDHSTSKQSNQEKSNITNISNELNNDNLNNTANNLTNIDNNSNQATNLATDINIENNFNDNSINNLTINSTPTTTTTTTTATTTTNSATNNNTETTHNHEKINIIQLDTVEQVNWTLENLMYGLTLSLEYQEIIKDCWNVYHDWLSVLLDEPKQFVPQAIRDDPLNYSKKMLWHLYHLFTPRNKEQSTVAIKTNELTKHVMMCHSVLMLIETIAKDSKLLQQDLWEGNFIII